MELYNKYRPTTPEEILGNDLAVKSVESELKKGSHVFLFTGPGGCGKAQPLDTIIPTPNGKMKFGDLKVGDEVYNRFGKPVKVIGVFDRGELSAFEVQLSDGRKTICNDDHLWSYFTSKGNLKTISLSEMIEKGITSKSKDGSKNHRYSIPTNKAINYPEKDLKINPYVIGSFLGNGCNTCLMLSLSSNDEFNVSECAKLLNADYSKNSEHNYTWSFTDKKSGKKIHTKELFADFENELCGYSHEKRIPDIYKYSSVEQRYELIKGLFDTDGSIGIGFRKNVSYSTTSEQLKNDIQEVLWSLGIGSSVTIDNREKNKHVCYVIHVKLENKFKYTLFKSPKKLSRLSDISHKTRKRYDRVKIVNVVDLHKKVPMRCIKVDDPEELYLTNDYIVTHNTTMARVFAKKIGADDLSIHELNSSENRGIDSVREIMEQIRYAPLDGGKTVYILDEMHQQTSASQNALLKVLENCPEWCVFFLCTTNPEKLIQPLKTRCSIVDMKPLDHNTMLKLIRIITRREGAAIDLSILNKVAELSNGSSRQGLKILSSIIGLDNDEERKEFLEKNVFSDEKAEVIELCRALLKQEGWDKYSQCLEKLKDDLSSNAEGVRQAVMGYANAVLKRGLNDAAIGMLQTFSNVDCYKNGKFGITIAVLDFISYMQG